MYPIGFPFWRAAAFLGFPLGVRIYVTRDQEADVYVATSKDLSGLVCEATTLDELRIEVLAAVEVLLQGDAKNQPNVQHVSELRITCPA